MNDLKGIIEDCNKSDLVSDKVIKKIIEIIGQEKWQDLYDEESDICTTMGELLITLKRIPDLEEENERLTINEKALRKVIVTENADLKKRIENLEMTIGTLRTFSNEQATSIENLAKENSELKEKNNQLTRKSNCLTECNDGLQELLSDEIKTQEQLVKSTELLKRCYENFTCLGPLRNEVKDFLKGVNIILEDAQAGNGPFDADEVFNKEMKAYSEEK